VKPTDPVALYLDLLKKTLTNLIYLEHEVPAKVWFPGEDPWQQRWHGRDWPSVAVTMAGMERLSNLQMACETVLREGVPGDLLEAGTWRGGAAILMQGVLAAHGACGERRCGWTVLRCRCPIGSAFRRHRRRCTPTTTCASPPTRCANFQRFDRSPTTSASWKAWRHAAGAGCRGCSLLRLTATCMSRR
jgi:hypothetical protein